VIPKKPWQPEEDAGEADVGKDDVNTETKAAKVLIRKTMMRVIQTKPKRPEEDVSEDADAAQALVREVRRRCDQTMMRVIQTKPKRPEEDMGEDIGAVQALIREF
jgi:hypothetical protein